MTRTLNKPVLAIAGILHLGITAIAWRDIQQRPAEQIRGSKMLWRILSGSNTGGSLAYLLIGRRR